MLTTLRIKNLALVADLTIELGPGYNVITGETGAGKSILIGALNLILGERADRSLIRTGSDSCLVEAIFDISSLRTPLKEFLEQNGIEPCEDHQLVVKRSLATSGVNRQFVNGSPIPLNTLATLGEWLIDIHGPHEHQSLLHPARQLAILDAFAKLEEPRETFGALVGRRVALENEKAGLIVDETMYAQQLDLLRFQVAEIAGAGLHPTMDEEVEREHRRASNAARLLQLSRAAMDLLAENETALLTQAGVLGRTLQELQRLDASAASLLVLHENCLGLWRDLQNELSRYADKIDLDPERLAQLEEHLNRIQSLKRKYGPSLGEVIAFGDEARLKLQNLESRDEELARLNTELNQLQGKLLNAGRELSAKRRKAIPHLSRAVTKQLSDLGFRQSHFEITLTTQEQAASEDLTSPKRGLQFTASGFDTVDFQFAPNPGEPPKPLRAIASSGELARVMLALKTVLAAEDQVPVLVFDEVDANVGGETANAVGDKMRQVASKRQVLCITHLPQVAAPASAHYVAAKQIIGERTVSQITRLESGAERVTELARMLGGQTTAARKHAQALLEAAR
ncbi:MAG TPA: DNA repair protein RecN [Candidatus Limnocylindrales bacterium]|nr:DNA repair protein RecN [Candidatus Limnocylindrales bacterium]